MLSTANRADEKVTIIGDDHRKLVERIVAVILIATLGEIKMKGVIFTAFLDHVETELGLEMVDRIIESSELSTGGAYTAVGTYDHSELVQMVVNLSEFTKIPIPDLLKGFGLKLFSQLADSYAGLLGDASDSFSLVSSIDNHIHIEVRKLYPDADLPKFSHERIDNDNLVLTYTSDRGFADVAEGLLMGCFAYFKEEIEIDREDLGGGTGKHVRFHLKRKGLGDE
ncbi:heme NO-binding domain-containing protein [Rubripirellula sp.]|nr:heme NO-binding domain-containing protein [Rubripirellula sp.]